MLRTSRFSTQTRDAWIASLVQEAGGAACRIRCTPPHAAAADRSDACPQDGRVCSVARDAGTVTDHGGAATGNADCCAQVDSLPRRGTPGKRRLYRRPEPPAVFVWTPPHAAEASSRCGCRKQPRVARRASTVGWPRNATSTPFRWLGVTCTTNKWFQPKGGLLPKSGPEGCRRCPMRGELVPGGLQPATVLP